MTTAILQGILKQVNFLMNSGGTLQCNKS